MAQDRVTTRVAELLKESAAETGRFAAALAAMDQRATPPRSARTLVEGGLDALAPVRHHLQAAVEATWQTKTALDPFLAVVKACMVGLSAPAACIGDYAAAWNVASKQAAIAKGHAAALRAMTGALFRCKRRMRELAAALRKVRFLADEADRILESKRKCGDELATDLEWAVANADDPEVEAALSAVLDQVNGFQADRDARIAADEAELKLLRDKLHALNEVIHELIVDLEQAAATATPTNAEFSKGADGPLEIETSGHVRPDAAQHAASLVELVLGLRVRLSRALAK